MPINIENLENQNEKDDEIDLRGVLSTFIRNKKFITLSSLLVFFIFSIKTFTEKKSWVGEFDIVLNSQNNNKLLDSLSNIPIPLSGVDNYRQSDLKTQIGILESPSVLMPIFEYVKSKKVKVNQKDNKFTFSTWKRNNLKFELKKQTSILNIKYRDTDKDSIIPVLTKISNIYQKYSYKKEREDLINTKKYLLGQIDKYKVKSKKSFIEANTFAMEEDLFIGLDLENNSQQNNNSNTNKNNKINDNFIPFSNIGIENKRVMAANKKRDIDIRIEKIKKLGDDSNQLQFIISNMPGLSKGNILSIIESFDVELQELRSKYKENDKSIKTLKLRQKALVEILKEKAIEYLKAERIIVEAQEESATRPKEILIRYKELLRQTAMDEKLLIELEGDLRQINLLIAKRQNPWELITNPTINNYSFGIEKMTFPFVGLIIGLIISYLIAVIKEKREDLVYDNFMIEKIFKSPILEIFNLDSNIYKINSKKVLFNEIININKNKNYIFLKTQNLKEIDLNSFIKNTPIFVKNNIVNTLEKMKNEDEVILLTSLNKFSKSEGKAINKRLKIQNKSLFGIIILEGNFE